MTKGMLIPISVLCGLVCVAALADRWNMTRAMWRNVLPMVVMSRQPSESEKHMLALQEQIDQKHRELKALEKKLTDAVRQRKGLKNRLKSYCEQNKIGPLADSSELLQKHPVANALVRSLDAMDSRIHGVKQKIVAANRSLEKLNARLIALQNGATLKEIKTRKSPSESIRTPGEHLSEPQKRYVKILQDVISAEDDGGEKCEGR